MASTLGPQDYLDRAKRGIYALKSGCIDKPGFAVDKQDAKGDSALLLACAEGAVDAAEIFLTLHASPLLRNRDGWSPLLRACHRGDLKLLTMLMDRLTISLESSHAIPSTFLEPDDPPLPPISYTCLQLCARYNHVSCAEFILKHRLGGGWRSGCNPQGWPVLHIACAFNHPEIVRLLLSHGAPTTELLPFDAATALHMAVARTDAREVLEVLIEAGADWRAQTIKGTSVPALAKERKRTECCRLLAEVADTTKMSKLRLRWQEAMTARTAEEAASARALSLVLGSVSMSNFPSTLLTCTALTSLDVSYNLLTTLPIASMTNLRSLNASHNQLTRIPSSLVSLSQLTELNLSHNPFSVDAEKKLAIKGDIARIRDYLRAEGTEVPLSVMRLFIVGQEAVGKTSLLRCLRKAAKEQKTKGIEGDPNAPPLSTDGIDIAAFTLLVADSRAPERDRRTNAIQAAQAAAAQAVAAAQGNSPAPSLSVSAAAIRDAALDYSTMGRHRREVEVRAWDCAGQALYHTTHEWFVADAAVCIVAWDLRYPEGNSRLEFWLRALVARTKRRIRVVLVGTHLDDKLLDPAAVKKALDAVRAKYTGTLWRRLLVEDVLAVSCATGKGIPELRIRLENIAASLLFGGPMIPRVVLDLEDALIGLGRERERQRLLPVAPFDAVIHVAKRGCGLSEAALPEALQSLHGLGSIVWLPGTAALRNVVFLDPQWLTHALATVVSTKNAFARRGLLSHKDLTFLWRDYPVSLHPTLLRVLVQFEVLYPFRTVAASPSSPTTATGHSPPTSPKLTRSGTVVFSGPLQAIGLGDSGGTAGNPAEDSIEVTNISLIPALLPEEAPDFSLVWPRTDASKVQLTRNYYLVEMPPGLISRLMVRLFSGSQVHAYWRHGLVLSRDSATLLVTSDPVSNVIRLVLRGPASAPPVRLLRHSTELLELLLDNWYHLSAPRVTVSCPHCLDASAAVEEAEEFELRQCEEEAAFGRPFVVCKRGANHPVRLDIVAPDVAMADLSHAQIPRSELEIGAAVGKGSFGTVYKARHRGQLVAVKEIELPAQQGGGDVSGQSAAGLYAEFRAECYLMMALQHPNVAQIRGFALTPALYLVMEFLEHGNLYLLLHDKEKQVPHALALRIALDVAMGMRFLHHGLSPPLLHRDLKSPNVMLASLEPLAPVVAKVTDFGLSLHLHVDELRAKESKHRRVVNPTWLAPEVLNSENETTRSDVYAYGIILYELTHRTHPFEEFSFRFAWQQEDAARKGVRPTLRMEHQPAALKELVEQCWAQDPATRPTFAQIVPRLGSIISAAAPQVPVERLLRDSLNLQVQVGGPAPPEAVTLSSRFVIPRPCTCIASAREQGEVWSGDSDGQLTAWDALSGKCGQTLDAHGAAVSCLLTVETEGRSSLWSAATDGTLRVWRLRSAAPGAQRRQGEHGGYVDLWRPEANSGKRLQDVLAGKASPWFRCYAALDPAAAMISFFRSAMERDLWRETYPLAGLVIEEVGEYKRRDHVVRLRLPENKELLIAFDTSGDKFSWKQALAAASPMRSRCEGTAPLTPAHASSVVGLAYVTSTGVVLSAAAGSLKLNVWSAKNPTFLRQVEPLGQSGTGRTVSSLLATDDLVCMIVERVVFVLDSQLTFLHGKPATRHAARISTLVGDRLWLADDVNIYAVDIRTGSSLFTVEMRGVAALMLVGDTVWLAAGNVLSLRDLNSGVERLALPREHQSKVSQIVEAGASHVWTIGADRIVCVWKR